MAKQTRVLGVEIGGTKLQVARGNTAGGIEQIERVQVPPAADADWIMRWVLDAVRKLQTPDARAVGVGFGGPVDVTQGRVLVSHQKAGWDGFPLRQRIEAATGIPAVIENDSNAAGWAEFKLGAGRGCRGMLYMNIGSGIGGAIIHEGRLFSGQGLGGGEIGHTWVPDWRAHARGAAVKLEDICSGWAIEARLRSLPAESLSQVLRRLCGGNRDRLTCTMLAEAAESGDEAAIGMFDACAESLAIALANAAALLHPERIVIGGGVANVGEVLFTPLRKRFEARLFGPYRGTCTIVPSVLGEAVVVQGALLLAGAAAGG